MKIAIIVAALALVGCTRQAEQFPRSPTVGSVSYGRVEVVRDHANGVICYVVTGSGHGVAGISCVEEPR